MTECGHGVYDASDRFAVSKKAYTAGLRLMGHSQGRLKLLGPNKKVRHLKLGLKRVTRDRNILNETTAHFAKEPK